MSHVTLTSNIVRSARLSEWVDEALYKASEFQNKTPEQIIIDTLQARIDDGSLGAVPDEHENRVLAGGTTMRTIKVTQDVDDELIRIANTRGTTVSGRV